MEWNMNDWDIVSNALSDYYRSFRDGMPEDFEMTQEEYDKQSKRIRELVDESLKQYKSLYDNLSKVEDK